jgi:hypothetical protein
VLIGLHDGLDESDLGELEFNLAPVQLYDKFGAVDQARRSVSVLCLEDIVLSQNLLVVVDEITSDFQHFFFQNS